MTPNESGIDPGGREASAPGEGATRVLLVEVLDVPGARPGHAEARSAALEAAGACVRLEVAEDGDPELRGRLRQACDEFQPERAVIAAAPDQGALIARTALGSVPSHLWSTSLSRRDAAPRSNAPRLAGEDGAAEPSYEGPLGIHPDGTEALDWALYDAASCRPRLPLWDARYLVAPTPLAGPNGKALLEAFAALDARWDQLDLVVLAESETDALRHARKLGVGPRVHFAGPSTRDAETTWLRAAAGVVFAAPDRLCASLVIAALAGGVPVLGFGAGAPRTAMGWLADRGATPASWASAMLPERAKLEHLLEHDAAVESAIARGEEVARRHDIESIGHRLAAALHLEERRRAA